MLSLINMFGLKKTGFSLPKSDSPSKCSRCASDSPDAGTCRYHPGRVVGDLRYNNFDVKGMWTCCNRVGGATGCESSEHVKETAKEKRMRTVVKKLGLSGFVIY